MNEIAVKDEDIFTNIAYFKSKSIRFKKNFCQEILNELKEAAKHIESSVKKIEKLKSCEALGFEEERNCLYEYGLETINLHRTKLISTQKALKFICEEVKRKKREK